MLTFLLHMNNSSTNGGEKNVPNQKKKRDAIIYLKNLDNYQ